MMTDPETPFASSPPSARPQSRKREGGDPVPDRIGQEDIPVSQSPPVTEAESLTRDLYLVLDETIDLVTARAKVVQEILRLHLRLEDHLEITEDVALTWMQLDDLVEALDVLQGELDPRDLGSVDSAYETVNRATKIVDVASRLPELPIEVVKALRS